MITGVILTHNEESNIVECISHLRPHVTEIILVDTSSTDRTVELASPLVDRVMMHPHVPNFDAARNIAIPVAKFDWLWFVDADEFVPTLTGELVNRWIRRVEPSSKRSTFHSSRISAASGCSIVAGGRVTLAPA